MKKNILFIIVAVFIALLIVEILLHIAAFFIKPFDPRYEFQSYRGKEWTDEFFRNSAELVKQKMRFVPLLEWKGREFHSTYINIDANGDRYTWNPTGTPRTTIWMFGGSTMWGAGARDEHTIPSYVSKILNSSSSLFKIINYGQGGYVFKQEAQHLSLLLRSGLPVPQYIIFYNGHNDAMSAYDKGMAGAITSEDILRQKLEASNKESLILASKGFIKDYCQTCRLIINLTRSFSLGALRMYDIKGLRYEDKELENLAQGVKEEYIQTLDFVDHLSRAYGFKYLVFWQPSFLADDQVVGDEAKAPQVDWRLTDNNLKTFFRKVFAQMSQVVSPRYIYFGNVLEKRTEQIYIDDVHISERGNEIIAQGIIEKWKKNFGLK